MIGCDALPPFFFGATPVHRKLQHHHHAIKAVKTTPIARPSKRCKAKWYTREHCDYSLEVLRRAVPEALAAVGQGEIRGVFNRSMRILEAYRDGLQYGCKDFKNRVYKAHRRIEGKSKW